MNKEEFLKGITILATAYNKEFTEEQVEVWYSFLKDYKLEEFVVAIQALIKTEKYLPSIAHITECISKTHLKDVPDAESEWSNVISAVHSFGSYREEEALNSLCEYTRKIVKLIGYYRICTSTQEEQVWNKKEFIEEYNSLKDKLIENKQIGMNQENLLNG